MAGFLRPPIRTTPSSSAGWPGRAIGRWDRSRTPVPRHCARPGLDAPNEADEINSSAAYGFIFDFCGVEIDRDTGQVRIDKYVTMHDAGRILNPALLDGQVLGGFAHGVGAALYEEFVYSQDGSFLSGTFADYPVPTEVLAKPWEARGFLAV